MLVLLACGCAGRSPASPPVELVRPDGERVACDRPSEEALDDDEAVGVASALPDIVHTLLDRSLDAGAKARAVALVAPSVVSMNVLSYRLCLEYGRGVLDSVTYQQWLSQVRQRLEHWRLADHGNHEPRIQSSALPS